MTSRSPPMARPPCHLPISHPGRQTRIRQCQNAAAAARRHDNQRPRRRQKDHAHAQPAPDDQRLNAQGSTQCRSAIASDAGGRKSGHSKTAALCQEETHAPQQDGCLSCHKVRPRQLRKAVIGNADLYSYSRQKMQIAPARYPRFSSRLSLDASENEHSDLRSIDQSPPLRYP